MAAGRRSFVVVLLLVLARLPGRERRPEPTIELAVPGRSRSRPPPGLRRAPRPCAAELRPRRRPSRSSPPATSPDVTRRMTRRRPRWQPPTPARSSSSVTTPTRTAAAATTRTATQPSWGRLLDRTLAVPGNHDHQTADAKAYFDYFGTRAGPDKRGWYAQTLGAWRLITLDSECGAVGGCGQGSPQYEWLAAELTEHPSACTVVAFHRPRYSSGYHGDFARCRSALAPGRRCRRRRRAQRPRALL